MDERTFFEAEALLDTLALSDSAIGLAFDTNFLLRKLKKDNADILNDAILRVLTETEFAADVEIVPTTPPPSQQHGFGLRLRRKVKDGNIEKVTFYRVKESYKTALLSLISLAAAIWMTNPTMVISGTSLLLTVWRNFITITQAQNKREIAAYEALLRVQIKKMQHSDISYYWPSTKEIHMEAGNKRDKDTLIALWRLLDLKLIEVKHWGYREYDTASMKNLWSQVF